MTNKEKIWVTLAVITAAVASFSFAQYRQERLSIVPLPDLPPGSTDSTLDFRGDRAGRVVAITGTTLSIQLTPVLGGDITTIEIDGTTVPLLVTAAPTGQGERGNYAQENPALLADFEVGNDVLVRYEDGSDSKTVKNVLKITSY